MSSIIGLILLLLFVFGIPSVGAQTPSASSTESPAMVNDLFRLAYSQAKKEAIETLGVTIVACGNSLVLVREGKRSEVCLIEPAYTLLKTADHVPLTLFLLLEKQTGKPLSDAVKASLSKFIDSVQGAELQFQDAKLSPKAKLRVRAMLDSSVDFAQTALREGVSRSKLKSFIVQMQKPSMENAYDAVTMELSALDAAVTNWRQAIPPADWQRLHVVVIGGHMPRDRERRMQYFSRLLKERKEGNRLIYMEGPAGVDAALDMLVTHIVDAAIGQEYFGDRWRMHSDLLAEEATRYLKANPPAGKVRRTP